MAASTFEQGQHPFFALLGVYLGRESARHASPVLTALAGLSTAMLFNALRDRRGAEPPSDLASGLLDDVEV